MIRPGTSAALGAALAAAAGFASCLRSTEFQCVRDSECGTAGVCESVGFCSVPDADCPGGRMFSDSAGQGLANRCVTASGGPGGDAGVDPTGDGPLAAGCPSGYASIAGSAHRYKLLANVSWDEAKLMCDRTSASAYLAIPDDATELANLATLAAPPFWIGIDDKATEGTYTTQKAVAASFLPWGSGEPDNGPPDQDCVAAVSPSRIATERCGGSRAAVCECEP